MPTSTRSTMCGICPNGCQVLVTLVDGRIDSVKPDRTSPFGGICPRGHHAAAVVHSPRRLTQPLVREGEKGRPVFREASWDEALNLVVENLRQVAERHGPEAIVHYLGRGGLEDSLLRYSRRFAASFGSPNGSDVGSLCNDASRIIAPLLTTGVPGASTRPEYSGARAILVWGTNPVKDRPPRELRQIREAKQRGTPLVVIDPRRTPLARLADRWIPVRPGTDGALALGLIARVIERGAYDRDFTQRWTTGFDEFSAYAATFTPERVRDLTGVDPADLEWLADLLGESNPWTVTHYTGLEYTSSGVQNIRAIYSLASIMGVLDVPGGLFLGDAPHATVGVAPLPAEPPPLGAREFPVFHALVGRAHFARFPAAVLEGDPYPVRSLYLVAGSPLLSYPEPHLWAQAYSKLDFFVVQDRFLTREADWADVVLPATTWFEDTSYRYEAESVRLRRPLLPPPGEALNDVLILGRVAKGLGNGAGFPQDEDDILPTSFANRPGLLKTMLEAPDGVASRMKEKRYLKYKDGSLRRDGEPGFPTPSGKVELASSLLASHGLPALPVYVHPYAGPDRFSLYLTTGGRSSVFINSQYLNIPELAGLEPCPRLDIHPSDAEPRGIGDGDEVELETPAGKVRLWAHVTDGIGAGTVHAVHGGGGPDQPAGWQDYLVNSLFRLEDCDPVSGYPVIKGACCEVRKE